MLFEGRKLCDLKPMFGVVFEDLIEEYEFWGHVDCDMILGDLAEFLSNDELSSHDILMLRGRSFVHGPLTVYRNNEHINHLYKQAPCWRDTIAERKVWGFDEVCKRFGESLSIASPADRHERGERVSMTDIVFTTAANGKIRVFDEDYVRETPPGRIPIKMRYERGKLFDDAPVVIRTENGKLSLVPQPEPREIAYFHLIFAKSDPAFHLPDWKTLSDQFVIDRSGVWAPKAASITGRITHYAGFYQRLFRYSAFRGMRRISHLLGLPLFRI